MRLDSTLTVEHWAEITSADKFPPKYAGPSSSFDPEKPKTKPLKYIRFFI